MRPRVFITQTLPASAIDRLKETCDPIFAPQVERSVSAPLTEVVREVDGIICLLTDRIDRELIGSSDRLRIIANVAVGYNNIDMEAARAKGITVTNTPDVLTDATADLTWALILAVTRRVVEADAYLRAGLFKRWDFNLLLGSGLTGKTLGIIGYGRIGRAVARRAAGFGVTVLYCGREEIAFRDDPPRVQGSKPDRQSSIPFTASARLDGLAARRVPFVTLLDQSDIVSIHVPLATATRHLIDRNALQRMHSSAYLINTSRGEIVDEDVLAEFLQKGRLAGAGLDVFEREPEVNPALLGLRNAVLLPHIGSATHETRTAMAMLAVENVIDFFSGRRPRNAL